MVPHWRIKLSGLLLLSLMGLQGCGFTPLYGGNKTTEQAAVLQRVEIANIPDRTGQILRNEIIDRFYRKGHPASPEYRLILEDLDEDTINLDITVQSDVTRRQLRVSAKMRLEDLSTGRTLLKRDLLATGSYNILDSQYTTRISRQNVRNSLLKNLASQVERQVLLSFN